MATKKRVLTCYGCGNQFDANRVGGGYDKVKHKYYCPSCLKKIRKEEKKAAVQERINRTGMKQTYLAMFLKIMFAVAFIGSAPAMTDTPNAVQTSYAIGIALLAWGLLPFIFRKKNK